MGKRIPGFVGYELSFLKLGSVLVGYLVQVFFEVNIAKLLFLRSNMCFGL